MEKWQDPETLALWFAIVILFVLILVGSIIFLIRLNYQKIIKRKEDEARLKIEHQRDLLENSIDVQEKERDRIASDLHDSLIGKLTAIRLTHQISEDSEALDQLIAEGIDSARRISHDLSPPLIGETPIEELLKDISNPWRANFKLNYDINVLDEFHLSARKKTQLSRIIQEILTNISKHAEATEIDLKLNLSETQLFLKISDNGKGLDLKRIKHGLGLNSIESRVQYINGKYNVQSELGKFTSFIIELEKQ